MRLTSHLLIAAAITTATLATAIPVFAANGDPSVDRIRKRHARRPTAVPELSANTAGAALVLLGGALLVANGRRRKKS